MQNGKRPSVSKEEEEPKRFVGHNSHSLAHVVTTKALSGVLNSKLLPCRAWSRTSAVTALPYSESLTPDLWAVPVSGCRLFVGGPHRARIYQSPSRRYALAV